MSGRSRTFQMPRNLRDGVAHCLPHLIEGQMPPENTINSLRQDILSHTNSEEIVLQFVDLLLHRVANDLYSRHPSLENAFIDATMNCLSKLFLMVQISIRTNIAIDILNNHLSRVGGRQNTNNRKGRPISDFHVSPNLIFMEKSTHNRGGNFRSSLTNNNRDTYQISSNSAEGDKDNTANKSIRVGSKERTSSSSSSRCTPNSTNQERSNSVENVTNSNRPSSDTTVSQPRNATEKSGGNTPSEKENDRTNSNDSDPDIVVVSVVTPSNLKRVAIENKKELQSSKKRRCNSPEDSPSIPTSTVGNSCVGGKAEIQGPLGRELNNLQKALELTIEESQINKAIEEEKKNLKNLRQQVLNSEKKLEELRHHRQITRATKINLCNQIAIYEAVSEEEEENANNLVDIDADEVSPQIRSNSTETIANEQNDATLNAQDTVRQNISAVHLQNEYLSSIQIKKEKIASPHPINNS